MKTKTKSIFISLLIVVLSWCTSAPPCACPEEISQSISTAVSTVVDLTARSSTVDGDICLDCGHTKTCCYNHKELSAITSAAGIMVEDFNYLIPLWFPTDLFSAHFLSKESMGALGNRAPPWIVKATLLHLHQKLLV